MVRRHGCDISIHALRKESDATEDAVIIDGGISIHALRKESDHLSPAYYPIFDISIHALRKESDRPRLEHAAGVKHFNPRSP